MDLPERVAGRLAGAIARVASEPERCARSPGADFTRSRKLPLEALLALLVCWGQDSMAPELCDMLGWGGAAPTPSALTQQWAKLNDDAMPRLHAEFLSGLGTVPWLGLYRLVAIDGTEVPLLPGTGGEACAVANGRGGGRHWELHCTVAWDLGRQTFEDMVCQGGAEEDEPAAACELVGRSRPPAGLEDLFLMDAGFMSLNLAWRLLEAGAHFVARANGRKASPLVRALLGGLGPQAACAGTFDAPVELCVTRTMRTARTRPGEPWLYQVLRAGRRFDGLAPGEEGERWMRLRVVRAPGAGGGLVTLVTDLPESALPTEGLLELYRRRWEEEVAFRHLKHVAGCRVPRTRDLGRAVQEVWGRLTLFNACSLGTARARSRDAGAGRAPDLTFAFKAFMRLLRGVAVDVARASARMSHAVRAGRGHARRARASPPPCALYRH